MIHQTSQLADVHFREMDGEALKKHARIWLETVLDERFDGETSLAELLVNGEILDRVSTKIRNVLPKYSEGEPMSPKAHLLEPKHSGKYLPYSNVDSFIKLCQKLGLAGVDLFSPPDVVEKKDIRKVCLCIRALSKKARIKALDLPDFDLISHTPVTMPKEFVGGIRGSLSAASSPSGPTNAENTPDKVKLSPLKFKRPFGQDETSSSVFLEDEKKNSDLFNEDNDDDRDTLTATRNNDSMIIPETPPVEEDDRSLVPSDDEKGSIESLSLENKTEGINVKKNLECNSLETISNEDILSSETVDNQSFELTSMTRTSKDDNAQCNLSEMSITSPGLGNTDGKVTKKGRLFLPLMASGIALVGILVGAFLSIKPRETSMYEVKKGDTLSGIARRTGKHRWQELLSLNPWIKSPDLIYPNERLKLQL